MDAFLDFVKNEWYFATPLFAMSLVAFGLVIWRLLLNVNESTNMDAFLPQFQDELQARGPDAALKFCRGESGIIPRRLLTAGLEQHRQGIAAMRRAMANAMELDILPRLNFLLPPILGIAKCATMVGLLFTVISMINTFNQIGQAQGDPTSVGNQASAIGLALFATAIGLMTAIPLVFTHVMFKDWIARQEVKMKSAAQKLLVLMQGIKSAPTAGKAAGPPVTPAKPLTSTDSRH